MSLALEAARLVRSIEADRRAQAQATLERLPPTPSRAEADAFAARWSRIWPAGETIELQPRADLAQARQRLDGERARWARAAEPHARPGPGITWRPTPTLFEANTTAASGNPVMTKVWDTSPVDPWSFDPTQPPGLPALPVNTAPPVITALDGTEVGDQLLTQVGMWTGGPTYARQWLRDGTPTKPTSPIFWPTRMSAR